LALLFAFGFEFGGVIRKNASMVDGMHAACNRCRESLLNLWHNPSPVCNENENSKKDEN